MTRTRKIRLLAFALALLQAALLGVSGARATELPDARAVKRRALLVGVDEFVSKPSTYPSSINNVYAMQAAFQASLDPFEALLLSDGALTSAEELTALIHEAFADAQPGDMSYLYISTHGEYGGEDGEPALLLSDGVAEGRVTAEQLERAFDGIAGTKVLLIDACSSGAFIGKGLPFLPTDAHFLGEDFKVFTSSGALEESWYWNAESEGERAQGAFYFTQALAQSLSPDAGFPADGNRDGEVTLDELYRYLLLNHAASTPQAYPQRDDTVVFRYARAEAAPSATDGAPIRDVAFSGTLLSSHSPTLTLEYVAVRPVRVAYQLVYQRGGKWSFDTAQLLFDEAERFTVFGDLPGAVSAGRKVRTLSIRLPEDDASGYVMVQLVSIEKGQLTVHGGRVLCVPRAGALPQVRVASDVQYHVSDPRELCVFVSHSAPCVLSVAIVDETDAVVRRLCHSMTTRPLQTSPQGTPFYWDGLDQDGEPVIAGSYRVRVRVSNGDLSRTLYGETITVNQ